MAVLENAVEIIKGAESQLNKYQEVVTRLRDYKGNNKLYLLGKLAEESGEVAKEIVKGIDGKSTDKDMKSELGDVFWTVAALAYEHGITLQEVMEGNIEKLNDRDLL